MENEEWRPVVGFEGRYEVSDKGRVRCMSKWHGIEGPRYVSIQCVKGYAAFNVKDGGKMFSKRVHRVVAEAFIPNPENKPQIDHIDGNPMNNRVENLRWCTGLENMRNPVTKERMIGINQESCAKRWQQGDFNNLKRRVAQFSLDGELIRVWDSVADAARGLGIRKEGLCQCCWGLTSKSHGYIWRYIEPGKRKDAHKFENMELIRNMEAVRKEVVKQPCHPALTDTTRNLIAPLAKNQ